MNVKIIPVFILLAAIALSGAAHGVYAEEINEANVMHEAPVREDSRNAIAPNSGTVITPTPGERDSGGVITPAPNTDNSVVIQADGARPLIGGNMDEHGCLGTAGYTWDQNNQACVRPWSGEVQSEQLMVAHSGDSNLVIGLEEPAITSDGQPETSEASFTGHMDGFWQALANLFEELFGWMA